MCSVDKVKFTEKFLEKFASGIIKHRKAVIAIFLVIAVCCAPLISFVKVNYNLADYLSQDAQSTKALKIMGEEFTQSQADTDVMLYDATIPEMLAYKDALLEVDGVQAATWLGDVVDVHQPLELANQQMVEAYYKDGYGLIQLTLVKGTEKQTVPKIQALVGDKGAVGGDAPATAAVQEAAVAEVLGAFAILLPAIIIILLLSTTSWLEPLLYLSVIGISIVINMGTNIVFGQISFMTNSVSPILQLAVSLDYAIFLLHAFARNRKVYPDVNLAMKHAVKESFSTVASSASTALFGFLALAFMQFLIGADLGINLAKGIIFSFLSVIILLPCITLSCYKLLSRTSHRELTPQFAGAGKVLTKAALPVAIVAVLLVVPAFMGQSKTEFLYGKDNIAANSQIGQESKEIKEHFESNTVMVLLVPSGDTGRELELAQKLEQMDHVISVISYPTMVGAAIPQEFLNSSIIEQFYSENYARLVVYTNGGNEGDVAFGVVEDITNAAHEYYGDNVYSTGQSASLYDMKLSVDSDNLMVNIIAVVAILLVLLIAFRSLLLPFLLVLSIETAIWINLAIPYFLDVPINFIGYLVISTVQLGATVNYSILLTTTYIRRRREMPKREAMIAGLSTSFKSILVSASVLSICGLALYLTTTNSAVADIGILLFRGTLLSFVMTVCYLPALLMLFDKPIEKTMLHANFFGDDKPRKVLP
jgi:predicted RND superfamily exporter protein